MKVKISTYPKGSSEREIDVHIDPTDTWSMDVTLSYIIVPMLKQLKETKHSAPDTEDIDVPEHLRSTSCSTKSEEWWESDANYFARWDWIMGEMIWAFEQYQTDWADQFYTGNADFRVNEDGLLVEGPNHTMQFDKESHQKHVDRMKHGRMLFAKYYECLWD
jgi:hypothetical protein